MTVRNLKQMVLGVVGVVICILMHFPPTPETTDFRCISAVMKMVHALLCHVCKFHVLVLLRF